MSNRSTTKRVGIALFVALIVPPATMFGLNSLMGPTMMDLFLIVIVEALAFVLAAAIWQARLRQAVLAFLLYFPLMFVVIFSIGLRAGFYDLP